MEFKDWLKTKLERADLHPTAFANAIKENQPTIQRLISGETRNPGLKLVNKIELYFSESYTFSEAGNLNQDKTPSNKVSEENPANHQFGPLLNNDILYSIKQLDNSSVNQLEDIIKHYVESDSDSREAIAQMSLSFRGLSDKRANAAKANDPDKDSRGDTEEGKADQ